MLLRLCVRIGVKAYPGLRKIRLKLKVGVSSLGLWFGGCEGVRLMCRLWGFWHLSKSGSPSMVCIKDPEFLENPTAKSYKTCLRQVYCIEPEQQKQVQYRELRGITMPTKLTEDL